MAPIVRIALRYLAAYLITRGYLSEGDQGLFLDPELIGLIVMALNESWYFAARKFGWEK